MPTLREFVEKARQLDITEGTAKQKAIGPRGEETFRFLRRPDGPIVILPNIEDSERLTPIVLSNLCRRLGISPAEFNLDLGFLQDPIGLWNCD